MKSIREMSLSELAAHLQTQLQQAGIQTVLSGGSAVSFYSEDVQFALKDFPVITPNHLMDESNKHRTNSCIAKAVQKRTWESSIC
jgi:hypothetical protein